MCIKKLAPLWGAFALCLFLVGCGNVLSSLIRSPVTPITSGLPPVELSADEKNAVGMNLWFLNDWDGSRAFVDAMKHSRPWTSIEGLPGPLVVDSLGWPLQDAQTVFISNMIPEMDNGVYTLVFEGQAEVQLHWVAGSVSAVTWNPTTNISTCTVTINCEANSAANLSFTKSKLTPSSPENSGFKNVRLYRPGYPTDGSKIFVDEIIDALHGAGVIRTMDWGVTNLNTLVEWSERTTPFHPAQGRPGSPFIFESWEIETYYGVSLEHMVQLSNQTDCDLWINIPAVASDDYVTKLAQLIRYGSNGIEPYTSPQPSPEFPALEPGLNVYIEYANEIWNFGPGFLSFRMIERIVANPPPGLPVLSDDGGESPEQKKWENLYQYPAYRLAEISKIFRSVWGSGDMMTRVRPVLCTQQGDANATLSGALVWADRYYRDAEGNNLNYYFWGAGGSAYYGVNQISPIIGGLLSENNYPDVSFLKNNAIDSIWARNYGLKRVAYEGGFGLDLRLNGELAFTSDEMWSIAGDPRTQTLVEKTHEGWSQTGGDLLIYYCLTGADAWAMTPRLDKLDYAKMRAFRSIAGSNKVEVSLGKALPCELVYEELARPETWAPLIRTGYSYQTTIDGKPALGGNQEGTMVAIPSHSREAFTGSITVSGQAYVGPNEVPGNAILGIWVNGIYQGPVSMEQSETGIRTSTPLSISVPEGLVVIRLEAVSKGYTFYAITVTR